ncbi:Tyrosyl-tRNA synthetase [Spirochaeta thermophila DSM 6578]|uniref:Tyrosine--tRNA ligase n=1 Tax=Winmispira thermophila (strain ATCC 700085 / DSM 6578 / Z-1203) TaxID=869211 RepID=G0GB47_WINT7|nr:tyrosine--tRNA ligase [Spirochaeta thermophila]AEJ61071.1 Tyrosyl-tRNA synthetase [Spirochaeta thermophila DSM 6578]
MSDALAVLAERGLVKQCTDLEGLGARMQEGPVTFYLGIDPTGPSLHAGHLVPLFAATHLVNAGHRAIILIGGGTARIGDPSGKTEMRRILSVEEIDRNARAIQAQIERFFPVDGNKALMLNNAEWLADLNYIDFLREIGRHFSVNRMLSFETYKARLETGLSFIEFNYQLLQAYDFLVLNERYGCTLQIGGDDQWGNIVAGIDLIRRVRGEEAYGLTMPLVTRSDGKKMGKTEKGALFLDPSMVSPYEFFQYWRNVPDQDVATFLKYYTFLPIEEIATLTAHTDERINLAKERLAYELTALIHGREEADKALEASRAAFGKGGQDRSSIPFVEIPREELEHGIGVVELFVKTDLCASKSEARRLISQGGAYIEGEQVKDLEQVVRLQDVPEAGEILLRAGKKRYFRVVVR